MALMGAEVRPSQQPCSVCHGTHVIQLLPTFGQQGMPSPEAYAAHGWEVI